MDSREIASKSSFLVHRARTCSGPQTEHITGYGRKELYNPAHPSRAHLTTPNFPVGLPSPLHNRVQLFLSQRCQRNPRNLLFVICSRTLGYISQMLCAVACKLCFFVCVFLCLFVRLFVCLFVCLFIWFLS